jgi:hypothetical protein
MNYDILFPNLPSSPRHSRLGGVQEEIFFSVMKVIHRQTEPLPAVQSNKVARVSCCCRISELMPLVRQMHDEARARAQAEARENTQQAA